MATALTLGPGSAQEDELSPAVLPVPVQVDEDLIVSQFLLELPHQPMEVAWDDLGDNPTDVPRQAFARLMNTLAAGQIDLAAEFHRSPPFADDAGPALAKLFVEGFAGAWESMEVVRRYDLGAEVDFAWEIELEGQQFRRVTRISKEGAAKGEAFWLEEMEPKNMTALQNILAEAEQALAEGKASLLPKADAEALSHHPEVPGTSARWHFNGQGMSFDAFAENPENLPDHPVARFFQQACQALKSGEVSAYADLFTPVSRSRIAEWAQGLPDGGYEQFSGDMVAEGRHVLFILEADPVYFVFYRTKDERTPYQVVYRKDEESYQMTNFFMEGIFDSLLKDEDFFVYPILSPLFGQAPEPEPEATTDQPDQFGNVPTDVNQEDGEASDADSPDLDKKDAEDAEKEPAKAPSIWKPLLLGLGILLALALLFALLKKFK